MSTDPTPVPPIRMSTEPPSPAQRSPRRRRALRASLFAVVLVFVVLPLAIVGFAWWLAGSESGTRTLASHLERYLPAIKLHGVEGVALGALRIGEIVIDTKTQRIVLSGVDLDWEPLAMRRKHLHIRKLNAARLDIESKGVESPPAEMPDDLRLPITIAIDAIRLDRANIPPVTLDNVGGSATYDGTRYRVDLAQLDLRTAGATPVEGRFKGQATLEATKPFALDAAIDASTAASVDARSVTAGGTVKLAGSLEELTARADLVLREAKTTATAEGVVVIRPFAQPASAILGSAKVKLQGIDLATIVPTLPRTRLDADIDLAGLAGGSISIVNHAPGAYDASALPVRSVRAKVDRSNDGFRFDDLVAQLGGAKPGGQVAGRGEFAKGALSVNLALTDVDLSKLDSRARPTKLRGRAQVAHANGRQEFTVALVEAPIGALKKQVALDAHGTLANQVLALDRAELTMGGSSVSAKARVALSGTQAFSAEGRLRNFRLSDVATIAKAPEVLLNGDFSASGVRSPALAIEAAFAIRDSQLAGHPLTGDGKVAMRGQTLDVPQLTLQSGANRVEVKGSLSSLGERESQLAFSVIAPSVEQLGAGYRGSVQAIGTARGTLRDPKIVVDWKIAALAAPGNIRVDASSGHAEVAIDRRMPFSVGDATATATVAGLVTDVARAASIDARVRYAPSGGAGSGTGSTAPAMTIALAIDAKNVETGGRKLESARLAIDGTPQRHAIDIAVAERDQRIAAHATGSIDDPMRPSRWQGVIDRFDTSGTLEAKLAGDVAVDISKTRIAVEHLKLLSNGATIDVERFEKEADRIVTRGRVDRVDIGRVLTLAGVSKASLPVDTDLVVDARWDLTVGSTWAGDIVIDRRSGDVRVTSGAAVALGLSELHAEASASNGRLQVRARAAGAQLGRINVDANTATPSGAGRFTIARNAPVSGRAIVDVPSLAWLGAFAPSNLTVAGALKADVALKGTIGQPDLDGQINGTGLRVALADPGIDLREGVLDATFRGTRLSLERLQFASTNGGTISISGPVDFTGGTPSLELSLAAKRYQVLNRSDRRLVMSGESRVRVAEKRLRVTGEFNVDSGTFDIGRTGAPTLSDDVVIVGRDKKGDAPMAVALDVRVRLGDGIALSGRGLDAILKGEVRLLNEAGQVLQAQGTFTVDRGTYTAYGQKLAIEEGLLRFTGAINNPQLSILAMRRDRTQEVEAGVSVRGTVLVPRITLVSEPSVPDAEKLSWLVLGRGLSSAGAGDMDALQKAAGMLLTNSAANGVSSQIATAFGLDTLSVGNSRDTVQQRIVTVGKRVSSQLYVSFQKGLETASNALLLRYTLTPRLTVEAETGTRSVLSLFYNISFD